MTTIEKQLQELRSWSDQATDNFLSIYADTNPSKPENAGSAWKVRVKNALKELPEIRNKQGKRDEPLYKKALELIDEQRPEARTFAMFLHRDDHGKLHSKRLDLQVEIPIVDIAHGKVEARYGKPYVTPLWFAVDEYERIGIMLLDETKWRFFEVFLGEIIEDEQLFSQVSGEDWKELAKSTDKIYSIFKDNSLRKGGKADKLAPKDRETGRVNTWVNKFYKHARHLLEKVADQQAIDRLVLIGEQWQTSHFETYLPKRLQNKLVARMPLWPEVKTASANLVWRRVEPAVIAHEREKELDLIQEVKDQPGVWGIDPVLDALQLGRVRKWILPWSLEQTVWYCPEEKFVAGSKKTAEIICKNPKEVDLRDYVLQLASEFGSELEFVRGEAETQLLDELGQMAALLRW